MRAKPPHVIRGRGFGKRFNFVKKLCKSPLAEKIGKAVLKELLNVYSNVANKISCKNLKPILQSDTANYVIESAAAYGQSKL